MDRNQPRLALNCRYFSNRIAINAVQIWIFSALAVVPTKVLKLLKLQPGSIVAMDRAYNDYKLFARWTEGGIFFVTRMKDSAVYEVVQDFPVPKGRNILSDEVIELTGPQAQKKCPHYLRRIVVWDRKNEREIVLITNHLDFGVTAILDRLLHRSHVLNISGRSYRLQDLERLVIESQ